MRVRRIEVVGVSIVGIIALVLALATIFLTLNTRRHTCAQVKTALTAFTQGLSDEAKADPHDKRSDAEINLLTRGFIRSYIQPINCG